MNYANVADILAEFVVSKLRKVRWGKTVDALFWEPREDEDNRRLFKAIKLWEFPEVEAVVELYYSYPESGRAEEVFYTRVKYLTGDGETEYFDEVEEYLKGTLTPSLAKRYTKYIQKWVERTVERIEKITQDVVRNARATHYTEVTYLVDGEGNFHLKEIVDYIEVSYRGNTEHTYVDVATSNIPPERLFDWRSVLVCPECCEVTRPAEVKVIFEWPERNVCAEPNAEWPEIPTHGDFDTIKEHGGDRAYICCPKCCAKVTKADIYLVKNGKVVDLKGRETQNSAVYATLL